MDDVFGAAAMAIVVGDLDRLAQLVVDDPDLAARESSSGHPSLLQLVACEASNIVEPVGAARLLMDAGAPTAGPLIAAAGCGSVNVLEFMLDRGADVNPDGTWTPLDEALYWAQNDVVTHLVGRGARVRALSTAAGLGDVPATLEFFDGGALRAEAGPIGSPFSDTIGDLGDDPQSIIDHAFVMAANNGEQDVAELLVERGANLNAIPPGYHWKGTALHAAVWRGHRQVVEWLLGRGADPSIRDGLANSNALGWAQHHERADLVELLGP